ncbi:MAG: ATP-dependent zinc metalloprotease FtsH [Deltaproteobacteria bacterium]|nr:ATP-dependent zinc metalloprotease FtsH [Deltaproteobacteria bacterium]
MSLVDFFGGSARGGAAVRYDELKRWVREGRIASVEVAPDQIVASFKRGKRPESLARTRGGDVTRVSSPRIEDEQLLPLLEGQGVAITVVTESFWRSQLPMLVWMVVLIGGSMLLWRWVARRMPGGPQGGLLAFGKSRGRRVDSDGNGVTFAEVAGVDEAKAELEEIVEFLRDAERFTRLGARIPKGVLLVGPPGTGKTLLARAVAGEARVPFFSITGSEFVEMFVGVGASRVRDLFEQAKAQAPCIVFIDELDALGRARGAGSMPSANEEREQTLDQLLAELDGFQPNAGVVVMAATNRPEVLDPALLRPGRFDRQVVVDRPDRAGRLAILRIHAKKLKLADDVDLGAIAERTPGFAGADLANLLNEAALRGARKRRDAVTSEDVSEAIDRVVGGLERRTRIITPAERRRVAFHEVGHAIVGVAVSSGEKVHKVSIVPRGAAALGYTMQLPTEDRYLLTERELHARIATLLGGRSAEEIVFGETSTGAQNDLRRATEIARAMVVDYGMSEVVGPVALAPEPRPIFVGLTTQGHSETGARLADRVDSEVRKLVDRGRDEAHRVLEANRAMLDRMAERLLERETLEGEELDALLAEVSARVAETTTDAGDAGAGAPGATGSVRSG